MKQASPPIFETPVPPSAADLARPPCYFWRLCGCQAALEKEGKSVCAACSARVNGRVYPLRPPTRDPLYASGHSAAKACNMVESSPRRTLNRFEPLRRPLVAIVHPPPDL